MLAYPDGARLIFGLDGVGFSIEPRLWRLPPSVVSGVDAAVPRASTVHMPPRSEDAIPAAPAGRLERLGLPRSPVKRVLLGLLAAGAIGCVTLLVTGFGGVVVWFCVLVLLVAEVPAVLRTRDYL